MREHIYNTIWEKTETASDRLGEVISAIDVSIERLDELDRTLDHAHFDYITTIQSVLKLAILGLKTTEQDVTLVSDMIATEQILEGNK